MTLAVVTQPSAALTGDTTGLGILMPISPLSGSPLNVYDEYVVDADFTQTQVVPLVEQPNALRRAGRRLAAWAARAVQTARSAASWMLTDVRERGARVAAWWRQDRLLRQHVARHSPTSSALAEPAFQLIQRLRAAREPAPEGNLPSLYVSVSRQAGSQAAARYWVERAVECLRDFDDVRSAAGARYEQGGYQFRC